MKFKIIALVPMKGHSERVPKKNMRLVCNRPLFHWIAASLRESKYVSRAVINTDSPEIARDAQQHFPMVTTLNRPEQIRGDLVSMNTIVAYDLSQVEGEHFLQTHSTNPLLTTASIDKAIERYFNTIETHDLRYWRHG